ncbi:MAG: hypothetical protein WCN98_02025 [Verrucomicrobiaceae bacterium]
MNKNLEPTAAPKSGKYVIAARIVINLSVKSILRAQLEAPCLSPCRFSFASRKTSAKKATMIACTFSATLLGVNAVSVFFYQPSIH